MSKFHMEFSTGNAAFGKPGEVARILREVADEMEHAVTGDEGLGRIRDINGNRVGFWTLEDDV